MARGLTPWLLGVALLSLALPVQARDWYVSAARGKGKAGTVEKPAKDLGNIASQLQPGDVVHIAGGTYTGKGDNGADEITVPVSIIGGYDDAFKARDPWGAHATILGGDNKSKNYRPEPRLRIDLSKYRGTEMPPIVVDGLIIDQGSQNRYKDDKQLEIIRKANPKSGENPTPDRGALIISASKTGNLDKAAHWEITVKNNIVMNSAPTQGALAVAGYRGSIITIENNIVINNTGSGIYAGTMYHGSDPGPQFTLKNNTVLFTWKYDAYAQSFSGNSLKIDDDAVVTATNNVFGFADRNGIHKSGNEKILLKDNAIFGNVGTDFWETSGDQRIALDDLEDESETLHEDSGGNVGELVKVPVSEDFLKKYGARVLIDRNAVEADIKAETTKANALRSILGLPLQAKDINVGGDVWLPRMAVSDALAVGKKKLKDKYGASADAIR